jgi:hypothetical protein
MNGKIIYTNHAKQRMEEREITVKQVEQAVYGPDYTMSSFEGKHIATKKIGNHTINVVYKPEMDNIVVITVY